MAPPKRATRRPVVTRASLASTQIVPYTGSFTCNSVAFIDKPDLEFGDKVILPPNVLVEIQRLKIPLPLLFKLTSSHASSSECCQYCGVMEFSAPVGQMYAPYWMMQQLGVDEGANVHLESALSIPRGLYCQLQPNRLEILDIAASIGPKILLESAMRRYSCLGVGGTIMIEYGDERFFLKLVQVKPGPVVHLFGDVDLEVDFKVPDSTDPRRPDSALHRDTSTDTYGAHAPLTQAAAPPHAADTSASAVSSYGRRLADGGYVPSTVPQSWSPPIAPLNRVGAAVDTSMSLKHAQTKAKKQTEGLDPLKFKAMKAFSTVGYTLTASPAPAELAVPCTTAPDAPKTERHDDAARPNPPTGPPVGHAAPNEAISCPCCLADLPPANADLHMLRCKQHTAYHRFVCGTCHERVLRTHAHDHVHCASCHFIGSSAAVAAHTAEIHAPVKCTCGASFPADAMAVHKGSTCPHAIVQCGLCFLSFQRQKFAAHYSVCSNRTQQCEVCNKYVNVVSFNQHSDECVRILPAVATAKATRAAIKSTASDVVAPLESPTFHGDDANSAETFSCPYCGDAAFANIFALDRHTESRCPIAKNFHATNDAPILRGKLRRKTDLDKSSSSARSIGHGGALAMAGERIVQPTKPAKKATASPPPQNNQHVLLGPSDAKSKRNSSIESLVQGNAMGLSTSKAARHKQVESLLGRPAASSLHKR